MAVILTNGGGSVGIGRSWELLSQGAPALDAIEQGIRLVEDDETNHSVGKSGWPNLLGQVELDAAIMDGATLNAGAVGAVIGQLHPISLARRVMTDLPHVMLVGRGAERFAQEIGGEAGDNRTPQITARWRAWIERWAPQQMTLCGPTGPLAPLARLTTDPQKAHGTTVFLALDQAGHIGAGVSTSGWALKYPGRLGDSPVIGAGIYADDRYGAAGCIGHGELTIRAGTARAVVLYLKMGLTLPEALREAARDLDALSTTFAGSVTIFALDRDGNTAVLGWGVHPDSGWVWRPGMAAAQPATIERAERSR
ncbi:MAG: isoaspartyl peptidase/L-asparaginase [Anaerolineae bacterium]|jgi:beta-aspartyl-peptidase (threonine type)